MKKRIQIDSSILSATIVLTGFLCYFPTIYPKSRLLDNVLDFIGLGWIYKGTLLLMAARGHKKTHSQQGESLVTTGPYAMVRNPMYLGTCLIGTGFVTMVWPWWIVPIFVGVFYWRFNRQIVQEEAHLQKLFGDTFKNYCQLVPRFLPNIKKTMNIKLRTVFNLDEAMLTEERRGLVFWPLGAVVMETVQERVVFGTTDIVTTLVLAGAVAAVMVVAFVWKYE